MASEQLVVGFDLDLTLIDSRRGVEAAMAALEAEIGVGVDPSWVANNLGPPIEALLGRWLSPGDAADAAQRYRELSEHVGVDLTVAMPGAANAVRAVQDIDGRVLVVTAKYEPAAAKCLRAVGIDADVVAGSLYGSAKAVALRENAAGVYVGDHVSDVLAARNAGAMAVMVASGSSTHGELVRAGAHYVLDSLDDFPCWLQANYT